MSHLLEDGSEASDASIALEVKVNRPAVEGVKHIVDAGNSNLRNLVTKFRFW